jgi:hypothetical protein
MINRINIIAETYKERPSNILFGDSPEYSNTQRFLLDEAYAYQLIKEKEKAYEKARKEMENEKNNKDKKNTISGTEGLKQLGMGNF